MLPSKDSPRPSLGRRDFLKGSGLAIAGAALHPEVLSAETVPAAKPLPTQESGSARGIDSANLLQGTNSSHPFSRGNTLPIAARPFGMAHWTLQSEEETSWMFHPADRRIQGLRCTHQLSPWLADYGHAVFLPFCGTPQPGAGLRSSSWRPEAAALHPYSLRLTLPRYQAEIELVPTERCCMISATFAGDEAPGFLIDVPGHGATIELDASRRIARFASRANHGGVPPNFATYYVVHFPREWTSAETTPTPHSTIATLHFPQDSARTIEARIGTSFISYEQAERNLAQEVGTHSIDRLREESAAVWNSYRNRIEIEGGSDVQRRTFDSCLYRALLFPHTWHEMDADGKPQHFSPYSGHLTPGVMYADHGYWDVYRAWYPFMSIVFPEKLAEILQSWVNAFAEGGWMPQFPCPGYRACMTGSLIDAVFADAAVKGIKGFDLETAYQGLRKHATQVGDPEKGYGRRGIEEYLKLGYVPADRVGQSVAETADAAYGDFCIAQIAKLLGHDEDAAMFFERSKNWKHLFDAKTGFLRGKKEDGSWLEPFDPFQWGSPYVEGSAWQHRWDVPHDIAGLIENMGGNDYAVQALDTMLSTQPVFHVGVYGQEIHEMSEMAAVGFGQYAHGNQPVHHLLYIFAVAGRPDRTQYWTRKVLTELYSPEDFAGDEDTGSMAAWYLLSAMGFYPLCPGRPEYVLGSPLFNKVTLHLPDSKTTVIEAHGQSSQAVYATGITAQGAAHRSPYISHDMITRGGRIEFFLQSSPNSRG
jgi:predicted alpha-1,2-mannosidase